MSLNMEDEAFGYAGGADDYRASRIGGVHSHVRRTRQQAEEIVREFEDAARERAQSITDGSRADDAATSRYKKARIRLICELVI